MSVDAPYSQNNESGSIRLRLPTNIFDHFPLDINWNGKKLQKKSEFHVTLLHAKSHPNLASLSNDEIASFFNEFVLTHPITFVSFIKDFRYAEEADKKTIIIRCAVANLSELLLLLMPRFESSFRLSRRM